MADLRNFSVARTGGTVTVTIPVWQISGQVVDANYADPSLATVLGDFTGANAVKFPQVLAQLTAAQQDRVVDLVVTFLLQAKGLLPS